MSFENRSTAIWTALRFNIADVGDGPVSSSVFEEGLRLLPSESDLLLSALEPFRRSLSVRVTVYDLGTLSGRFWGLINGVFKAPSVICNGKRYEGLEAARLALRQLQEGNGDLIAGDIMTASGN